MAKIKEVEVYRQTIALPASGSINVDIPKDKMPGGLIHGFTLRLESAAITGFGSAAANYQQVLQNITYGSSTPNHTPMNAVPGLAWDRYQTLLRNKASERVAPTANGFMYQTYLPFSWRGAALHPTFRPKDSALLNIKNQAAPYVSLQLGSYTLLSSAATACSVVVILVAHYEEDPKPGVPAKGETDGGDQPTMMLEISVKQKSDISTSPIASLLKGGGRFNLGVGVRELNATAGEVSDIFTVANGNGAQSKFEIVKGSSDNYTPRMKVAVLDSIAADYFGAQPAAGVHLWMSSMSSAGKSDMKGADAIALDDTFELQSDNLATTASRVWEVAQFNHIQLPKAVVDEHLSWLGVKPA